MDNTTTTSTSTPPTDTTSSPSITSVISDLLGTGTGKGAALGALFGNLLSSYGQGAGGVNLGVDMSKIGAIPARNTTISPTRFVPYSDYGTRDVSQNFASPEMLRQLGVASSLPTGGLGQTSSYNRLPTMATAAPTTISNVGSGASHMVNPTLTPKNNTTISPLTGALMGSAIGYLTTPNTAAANVASSKGTSALNSLINSIFKTGSTSTSNTGGNVGPNVPTGSSGQAYWTDSSGRQYSIDQNGNQTLVYDPSTGGGTAGGYNPTDFGGVGPNVPDAIYPDQSSFKDGGMATPLMADGGQVSSYYTYGTPVNPADVLQGYARGGEAHQGGLHVPVVQGRHDYREGSRVTGEGDGQSDDIPAMLAQGEYVFDADTVAQLGNGSTEAGSKLLDEFRIALREHKRSAPSDKIPPKGSPLQYMKVALQRSQVKK